MQYDIGWGQSDNSASIAKKLRHYYDNYFSIIWIIFISSYFISFGYAYSVMIYMLSGGYIYGIGETVLMMILFIAGIIVNVGGCVCLFALKNRDGSYRFKNQIGQLFLNLTIGIVLFIGVLILGSLRQFG